MRAAPPRRRVTVNTGSSGARAPAALPGRVPGSIAHEVARADAANPRTIWIEHPSGVVDVVLETKGEGAAMDVVAGTLRTARPIMKGEVLVPAKLWPR